MRLTADQIKDIIEQHIRKNFPRQRIKKLEWILNFSSREKGKAICVELELEDVE
jgi:hypothetical protein